MKKLGIGEIAREIGWPALLRQIEEAGEPVAITRGNGTVAFLMPCDDRLLRYLEDSMTLGKVMKALSKVSDDAVKEYLAHQMAVGFIAKMMLSSLGEAEVVAAMETRVVDRLRASMKDQTEDRATVGIDPSAGLMKGGSRRQKKPAASPTKKSPSPKR